MVGAILFALVADAAHAAPPDKAKLAQARSLTAEIAAVEAVRHAGGVTSRYADGLVESARKDLQKLTSEPGLGPLAAAAIAALDRHDIARLVALRDRLVALERSLGRAA